MAESQGSIQEVPGEYSMEDEKEDNTEETQTKPFHLSGK